MQTKTVLGFASEEDAAQAAAVISETPGYEDFPLAVCQEGGRWFLECYDGGALNGETAVRLLGAAGLTLTSFAALRIPEVDWVSETQKALPPVQAGRFTIHGSHDRIASQGAIEIDAGRAFGTAHHGTTKGCLLALSRLGDLTRPRAVLDLGTGSGVLAIAAAKAFAHKGTIAAVDLDPIAIDVARENCGKNGAGAVAAFCGRWREAHRGLSPCALRYRGGEYSGEAAAAARAALAGPHAAGRHCCAVRVAVESGARSAGPLPLDGLLPDPAARC